jgi:S-formylglutathione hydrolase FrmB
MGGYGAIKLAIKHPEVFGLVAANSPIVSFSSLKYTVPVIIQENPNGMTGPDPSKFNTSAVYAFSAAFSPNLSNPPFYVDLPFEWPDPGIIDEVWARWLDHDPGRLLSLNHEKAKLLNGFYYDLGTNDEFGFLNFEDVSWFNLGLNFYEVEHVFQSHDGKHWSNLYERMEIALKYISDRIDLYQ